VVRPIGKLGSLGLVLPTAPQADLPAHPGSTTGTTEGGTRGSTGAAAALARVCTDAEDSGAGALWAVDHLFWPRPMLECLTTLAVATTATRHAVVGSCVLQLAIAPGQRRGQGGGQPAGALRRAVRARHRGGSHPGEYAAAGVDFASRGRLVDEGLAELHRSWDSATDRGSAYRQEPQPSPIPVWIGGSSRAALRRAATAADGWVPLFMSPAEYEVALGHLGEASVAAGRAADEVLRAVVVMVSVGPEPAQATDAGTRWLSSLYGIRPRRSSGTWSPVRPNHVPNNYSGTSPPGPSTSRSWSRATSPSRRLPNCGGP